VSLGDVSSALRITVTDQYNNLVGGAAVTLTTDLGTLSAPGVSPGASITVATASNGVALASLASTTAVATATVTAEITTTGRPSATTQVYFKPGLPFTITSEAYPATMRVCGDSAVVTATIQDQFGNLVEDGTEVNFNVVPGERGDTFPRLTYTANGIATTTVRSKAYLFGERKLRVNIMARRETRQISWFQDFDLEVGAPEIGTFHFSPSYIQAGGKDSIVELRVTDCAGNAVPNGTVVTFTVGPAGNVLPGTSSTLSGLAYTTFRSGCFVGWSTITAEVGSKVFTASFLVEPGPADHIVASVWPTSIQNCGGTAVFTATVQDICNNLVRDNTPVVIAPQYNYVSVSRGFTTTALTRGGIVTATVRADRLKPIAWYDWPAVLEQIEAASAPALPGFASLVLVPGVPHEVSVSVDPAEIPINGDVNGYNIIVEALVRDCTGTPVVDGTGIRLETTKGFFRESGTWFIDLLTAGGEVTATLTSQSVAHNVLITGTSGSATGTARARFLPDEPWLIEVWGYPPTIYADGHSSTQISARVYDVWGNDVGEGVEVTFVTDYGRFINDSNTFTTTTVIDGLAFATLIADVQPRTVLVRAITNNYRQGYTYVFFITPPTYRYIYMPMIMRNRLH